LRSIAHAESVARVLQTLRNSGRYFVSLLLVLAPLAASAQMRTRPNITSPRAKPPVVKRFVSNVKASPIIASHVTSVGGGKAKVQVTLDLGEPMVDRGHVVWPKLAGFVSGVMLEESAKSPVLAVTIAIPEDASGLSANVEELSKRTLKVTLPSPNERVTLGSPIAFRSLRTITVRVPVVRGSEAISKLRLTVSFNSNTTGS
jgi:hypothetical protein